MTSLITLLKILLFIYLGSFTYITYQIIFYFQKKLIIIKTLSFFFLIALLIIHTSNKYDVVFFIGYLFFYTIGIIIARHFLKTKIRKNTKLVKHLLYIPFKKCLIIFIKKAIFYSYILKLKNKVKMYKYYKKYPHKKPKSIYELFWQRKFIML